MWKRLKPWTCQLLDCDNWILHGILSLISTDTSKNASSVSAVNSWIFLYKNDAWKLNFTRSQCHIIFECNKYPRSYSNSKLPIENIKKVAIKMIGNQESTPSLPEKLVKEVWYKSVTFSVDGTSLLSRFKNSERTKIWGTKPV